MAFHAQESTSFDSRIPTMASISSNCTSKQRRGCSSLPFLLLPCAITLLMLMPIVYCQQTLGSTASTKSIFSDLSLDASSDNMIGQVWKRVQEQIAAATRNDSAKSKQNQELGKRLSSRTKYSLSGKRKLILDHYATQIKNTSHFDAKTMSDRYRNASHTRFTSKLPPFPDAAENRKLIQHMFTHAYDSYMYHAFPEGQEVNPLSCTPGQFGLVELPALTLLDSLDTLLILGNATEFARSVERLRVLDESMIFSVDQNVSVFETNIRVLGGLLSAHQLALAYFDHHPRPLHHHIVDGKGTVLIGPVSNTTAGTEQWKYDGVLLDLAVDIAERLIPAFRTETGIPFGTVNLLDGVPQGETPIASLAGAGTLSLEFSLLSALTGNSDYAAKGKLATRALFFRRHAQTKLLGKHIDTTTGQWTETVSGIGSNSDSFYEYLAKHSFVFGNDDTDFWTMFAATYEGVHEFIKNGNWYTDAEMSFGQRGGGVLESLAAFFPGLQATLGEVVPAGESLNEFTAVRETVGVLPERFSYISSSVLSNGYYPLRPELLESVYHMHRTTREPGWQWAAHSALHHLQRMTKARCGYSAVVGVRESTTGMVNVSARGVHQIDEMPSFFLSETLKYLYLTFDDNNFLHTDKDREWVFTTEAHPIHSVTNPYVPDTATVKEILKNRLHGKRRSLSQSSRWQGDKWSKKTTSAPFQIDIGHLEALASNQTQPPIQNKHPAHQPFRSQERTLRAACLNQLHNPVTLWTRALTGGVVDYTVDTGGKSLVYDPFGALAALGHNAPQIPSCPLKTEEEKAETSNDESQMDDLGMFEVSSRSDGFFVRNKANGEQLTTHMVYDDLLDEKVGMVYMELKHPEEKEEGSFQRTLTVFDFQNHAVTCKLEVLSAEDSGAVLLEVPCCPALFGPSTPSKLLEQKEDLVVESPLVMPKSDDLEGCLEPQVSFDSPTKSGSEDDVCEESTAQVVHRGDCPFFAKAANAKGSDLLVVVNNDESGLFMMSSSSEQAAREDVPLSVLISSQDGEQLESISNKSAGAQVRVSLERSLMHVDSSGKIYSESTISWPVIGGSGDTLHLLTSSGWGIKGLRSTNESGTDDWQLQLVKLG